MDWYQIVHPERAVPRKCSSAYNVRFGGRRRRYGKKLGICTIAVGSEEYRCVQPDTGEGGRLGRPFHTTGIVFGWSQSGTFGHGAGISTHVLHVEIARRYLARGIPPANDHHLVYSRGPYR